MTYLNYYLFEEVNPDPGGSVGHFIDISGGIWPAHVDFPFWELSLILRDCVFTMRHGPKAHLFCSSLNYIRNHSILTINS